MRQFRLSRVLPGDIALLRQEDREKPDSGDGASGHHDCKQGRAIDNQVGSIPRHGEQRDEPNLNLGQGKSAYEDWNAVGEGKIEEGQQ